MAKHYPQWGLVSGTKHTETYVCGACGASVTVARGSNPPGGQHG